MTPVSYDGEHLQMPSQKMCRLDLVDGLDGFHWTSVERHLCFPLIYLRRRIKLTK